MWKRNKEKNLFDWNNINGDKYYKINDIIYDEDMDDITKQVKLVALITNQSEDDIWAMPLQKSTELINKLNFLNKFDFNKEYDPHPFRTKDYNLYLVFEPEKISLNQFVDYQIWSAKPVREGYDKLISIFLIPDGKEYGDGYDVADIQRFIREEISWPEVQSILYFFISSLATYIKHTLRYLDQMEKKMTDPKEMEEIQKQKQEVMVMINNLRSYGSM